MTDDTREAGDAPERIWVQIDGEEILTTLHPVDCVPSIAYVPESRADLARPTIEESALLLFKAFQRSSKLDMAQAVAHLMEIYYSHDESLIGDAVIRLEILAGMSDQEWPAIIGGEE